MTAAYIAMEAMGAATSIMLLLFSITERSCSKENRYFILMIAALIAALLSDLTSLSVQGVPALIPLAYATTSINYIGSYLCVNFFLRYLCGYASNQNSLVKLLICILDVLCALSVLGVIISLPTGWFFTIDENCVYVTGNGYLFANLYSIIALAAAAVLVFLLSGLSRRERALFLSYPVLPLIGVLVDYITGFTPFTYIGAFLSMLILYLWIFAKRGRLIALQEAELAQSRIAIMLSQIQPHFLYNSLNSIGYLCEKNPSAAKKAVDNFADYLRANLDSLKRTAPVPFEKELEHVRIYLSLEKMRFENDLNVVWDIRTTDFLIPALTVQPLVENAVRYGVGKKIGGGTVTIASQEYDDRFEVVILDDGVGYDPNAAQNDGRTHIGIDNVRSRLASMVNGTLEIKSKQNQGAAATITIPKENRP